MSWQKCPVCNGVGAVSGGYFNRAGDSSAWSAINAIELCKVCVGKGIIDEVTGEPPKEEK